jgi:hypothetical protein
MRKLLFVLFLMFVSIKLYSQSPLCASRPTTFCCEYVANITINGQTYAGSNGFTNTSGGNPAGYYDYTSGITVPTITAGQNISISYTAVTNGNYMEYFKLWIDFNGNGVLTDAGELIHSYNVSWTGTKIITSSFIVPTSVYNGKVYMRFIMQYSGSPVICGTYAYGNTFDFKATITGATDPFSYTGYIYNSEGIGVSNISLDLYSKLKSDTSYTYLNNIITDANGKFILSSTRDAGLYDFELRINTLTISSPTINDAKSFNQNILKQSFNAKDYYRMDVNGDDNLTVTDIYLIYMKIIGRQWKVNIPNYRLFQPSEWTIINNSNSNIKINYPGVQTITLSGLINKGNSIYYIVRTGYKN